MPRPLIVFLGGGLGAGLRALLLAWLAPLGALLPIPVLLVNLLGASALGVLYVLADEAKLLRAETRLFLAVGVLGGFTTFSTFAWGNDLLLNHRSGWLLALLYTLASAIGGVLAVQGGLLAGRRVRMAWQRRTAPSPSASERRDSYQGNGAATTIRSIEAEDSGDPI